LNCEHWVIKKKKKKKRVGKGVADQRAVYSFEKGDGIEFVKWKKK
jgi:hypothetical protein